MLHISRGKRVSKCAVDEKAALHAAAYFGTTELAACGKGQPY